MYVLTGKGDILVILSHSWLVVDGGGLNKAKY